MPKEYLTNNINSEDQSIGIKSNDKNACYRWNGRLDDFVNHAIYPSGGGKGCAAIEQKLDLVWITASIAESVALAPTLESESCSNIFDRSSNESFIGVCQYKACRTTNNKMCKFPFR